MNHYLVHMGLVNKYKYTIFMVDQEQRLLDLSLVSFGSFP